MSILYFGVTLLFCIACGFIIFPLFTGNNRYWRQLISLCVVVLVASLSLYWHWGANQALTALLKEQQKMQQVRHEIAGFKSVDDIIKKMELHLQQHPDAKGWYLLGRLYYSTRRFSDAVTAFKNADQLKPNDATILFQLALSQAARDERLSSETKELLHRILKQDPKNQQALALLNN